MTLSEPLPFSPTQPRAFQPDSRSISPLLTDFINQGKQERIGSLMLFFCLSETVIFHNFSTVSDQKQEKNVKNQKISENVIWGDLASKMGKKMAPQFGHKRTDPDHFSGCMIRSFLLRNRRRSLPLLPGQFMGLGVSGFAAARGKHRHAGLCFPLCIFPCLAGIDYSDAGISLFLPASGISSRHSSIPAEVPADRRNRYDQRSFSHFYI